MGSAPIKRTVIRRAHCDETVEIQWTFNDGSTFIERHTCPPKSTREKRLADEKLKETYTMLAAMELKDADNR